MNDIHTPRHETEPDGVDVISDIHTRRELALYRLLADVTVNEKRRHANVFFMAAFFALSASITCWSLVGKVASPLPVTIAGFTWLIVAILTTLSGVWTVRTARFISNGKEEVFRFHEDRLDLRDRAAGIDPLRVRPATEDSKHRTPWWKRIDPNWLAFEAGFLVLAINAAWGIVLAGLSTWPTMAISLTVAYILRWAVLPALDQWIERWILRRRHTRNTTDTAPETVRD